MKRLLISLLTIACIVFLVACNDTTDSNEEEERSIPVETVEAIEDELVINKVIYGRTTPLSMTPIILNNPGEIDTLEVHNGDQVKKDDLIAKVKTQMGTQNIRASKEGEIINLEVEEGGMASNEQPLAVIADLSEIKINITVTSNARSLFKKDKEVNVQINDEKVKAKITSISSVPDDTGLYPIEAIVKNKDDKFLAGMVAVVTVPERKVKDTIILPTEAIVEETEDIFVFVVKDGKAVKTEVKIIESQSDKTAVEGEVKAGDIIVINGQLTLSDGSQVNVVTEEEGNKS